MPVSTAVKAGTQDATSGIPVAVATNEVASGNALQTMVGEGNKSTYTEVSRTGIAGLDTAVVDLSSAGFGSADLATIGNALAVQIRASCSVASATLTGHLVFYDGSGVPKSISESISFTSSATLRLAAAGDYIAQRQMLDAGDAIKCKFYVTARSAGTWAIYVRGT